ncbi:MAG: transcriptional regulatory protein OmpR [Rhodospirillales bacterium]|jgi:DNA-binding response OmpR family regulator|nr:transcriptional regulatory protein OmpR [Rhodospirillales bacterium]
MSKKCHILAVEDDPLVQDLFAQILTGEGFDFSAAASGQQMREKLAAHEIHVVLMDVILPGGENGIDLAEGLVAAGRTVILISGYHDHFERIEQSGMRYLHKPFRIPALLQSIKAALRETNADCDRNGGRRPRASALGTKRDSP